MAVHKNKQRQKLANKNPDGTKLSIIHHELNVFPVERREQTIPNWRQAHKTAEALMPNRFKLYSLYADVELDGHVEAVISKRIDPVTNANWSFVDKNGETIEEIAQMLDTTGFEELLTGIMMSKFWGYKMMEPKFFTNDDGEWEISVYSVPYLHMRPELGIIAKDIYGDAGIDIRTGIYAKTVMEVGRVDDLGLYLKVAPYQILKRGGFGDYAMFVQVFGNPIVDATWDGFNEDQRKQLLEAISTMGNGGALVRPAGTQVTLLQNQNAANGQLQDRFIKALNREISKTILGSTETTESSESSGNTQAMTHQEGEEVKHESDLDFVRRVLNSRFRNILRAHGFDTKGGRFVIEGEENTLSPKESFEIHKYLFLPKEKGGLDLPVDHDFLYETYGVPKPQNYDQIMAERAEKAAIMAEQTKLDPEEVDEDDDGNPKTKNQNPQNSKQTNKKRKKENVAEPEKKEKKVEEKEVENKKNVALSLFGKFLKLFDFFHFPPLSRGGQGEFEEDQSQSCGCHHTINLTDPELEPFTSHESELIQKIAEANGAMTFSEGIYTATANTLLKGFKNGWNKSPEIVKLSDIGFSYDTTDPAILSAYELNIFRFSAAKSMAEVQLLNQLYRESSSFEEFYAKAIQQLEIFNKKWLETEYTTATLVGEAAATYHRLLSKVDIFPYWQYMTVGDEHVREEHMAIHGLILRWDDPRWSQIFPPNGWNCRCYVVPRLASEVDESQIANMQARADNFIKSPQFQKAKAQGFGVNRGATGEIFTANQMYTYKQPNQSAKKLNNLKPSDYGLESYAKTRNQLAQEPSPLYTGSEAEFYNGLETLNGNPVLRDYNNRPLQVPPPGIADPSTSSAAKLTLQQPDEVWINGGTGTKTLDTIIYLKYFQDQTMIVTGQITEAQVLAVREWKTLTEVAEQINLIRRGILIKKP